MIQIGDRTFTLQDPLVLSGIAAVMLGLLILFLLVLTISLVQRYLTREK